MTRILAIDQARKCGWAWGDGETIESGVVDLNSMSSHPDGQLDFLIRHILAIHKRLGVDQIAYEKPAMAFNDRAASASSEKIGIIKLAAFRINAISGPSYAPKSVKLRATGSGDASKDEMIRSAMHSFDIVPRDDNEADALWILQMAREGYVVGKTKKSKKKSPPKSLPGQLTLFGDKPRRVRYAKKNQAPPPTDSLEKPRAKRRGRASGKSGH